jgi:hypothetical protein
LELRIVSDGTGNGTRVVNAETDEELKHVAEIEWQLDYFRGVAQCTLRLTRVHADLDAAGVR